MHRFYLLNDIMAIKQFIALAITSYKPFTLKCTGDKVEIEMENEEDVPEQIKTYVLKATVPNAKK